MSVSTYRNATAAVLALTVAATIGAPAFAGGYADPVATPVVAAPPAPVMAAPVYTNASDWGGFYGGASLGYADVEGDTVLGTDISGMTYGLHGGYNYDMGSYVIGGELEYSMANDITDDTTGLEADSVLRAKARFGYDAGAFMPYATIGAAQLTTSGAVDDSDTGYLYGVGVDYKLRDNVVLGAEVLQHRFDDYADTGINVSALTAEARVSFRF